MTLHQTTEGDDALVGYPILVAVGQGQDLAASHIAHMQYAVVVEDHQARIAQARHKYADRKTLRYIECESLGHAIAELLRYFDFHGLEI